MNRTAYGSYTHPDDPGEPATKSPRISVTDDEAELLAYFADGKTVLEIGTGLGVSTRALARHATMVDTLDTDPWVRQHVWPILLELPVNFLVERHDPMGIYEMVFIDGEHKTVDTREDIAYACTACARGMIVVHDTNMDTVKDALVGYDWHHIPTYHGMGIIYRGWT